MPKTAKNSTLSGSRRQFFKNIFFLSTAGSFVYALASETAHAAASALKLIDMSQKKRTDADNKESVQMASGLGYVDDLAKGMKAGKIVKAERPGFKPTDQTCGHCMFFNYKKETPAVPTCQLLSKVLVNETGSCNSWAPKV